MADIKSLQRRLHSTARKLEYYKEEIRKNPGKISGKLASLGPELAEEMEISNKEMCEVIAEGIRADPNTTQMILQTITFLERNKAVQETAAKMQAALFGSSLIGDFSDNLTRVAESLKRGQRVEGSEESEML